MTPGEILAEQIERTRQWTCSLLEDVSGEDWFFQPKPGLQHCLWICGHLASAQDTLLFTRCLNQPRLDAGFKAHFGIGGPVKSKIEHDWPTPADVRQTMDQMQAAAVEAVKPLTGDFLAQPASGKDGTRHPMYDTKLGAISHMTRHEAFHAGQLATLRRLLGKPFLR